MSAESETATNANRLTRSKLKTIAVGTVLICLWQASFIAFPPQFDGSQQLLASAGLQQEHRFVYFLYHLNLWPLATLNGHLEYTREGAKSEVAERGELLLTEVSHSLRTGEYGKAYLFLPDAFLRGTSLNASVKPANILGFITALCLLFASSVMIDRQRLGGLLVLLLGSNPFQLQEVYHQENVFGWVGSSAIALLAVNLSLMLVSRRGKYYVLIPLISGGILAFVREVRSEPIALLLSLTLIYLTVQGLKSWKRVALVLALFVSFALTSKGLGWVFQEKIQHTSALVTKMGGVPFPPEVLRARHHSFWHPFWCGLGDFGQDRGYEWEDGVASERAMTLLKRQQEENGGAPLPELTTSYWGPILDESWDPYQRYYKVPFELPGYDEALRNDLLSDIAEHPLWYARILGKRSWRILTQLPRLQIAVGKAWVAFPDLYASFLPRGSWGLLLIPSVVWFWRCGSYFYLKLIFLVLPTSLTALLIYSGGNTPMYSLFHIVLAAALIEELFTRFPSPDKSKAVHVT